MVNKNLDTATFASGCFWCTEAIFQNVKGVSEVVSGYTGGSTIDPTYKEVCSGETGHAEACNITFDSNIISYDELLEIFFKTHDPTSVNRQGADVGTQYRSAIFFHNSEQKQIAEYYIKKLNESGIWSKPIVTEVTPYTKFYRAEDYHQNYYNQNPGQGYCNFVITPKLEKFKEVFKNKLK